ncbi:MAG: hypothetical protein PHQ27_10995, partial [Victivallales bacterium]|nr:hypothetical protein [Victivallales bacterium]
RNQRERHFFFRARRVLTAAGCRAPDAVLFRCNTADIHAIAAAGAQKFLAELRRKTRRQLKWQVLNYRFFRGRPGYDLHAYRDKHQTEDKDHGGNT